MTYVALGVAMLLLDLILPPRGYGIKKSSQPLTPPTRNDIHNKGGKITMRQLIIWLAAFVIALALIGLMIWGQS